MTGRYRGRSARTRWRGRRGRGVALRGLGSDRDVLDDDGVRGIEDVLVAAGDGMASCFREVIRQNQRVTHGVGVPVVRAAAVAAHASDAKEE